MGNINKFEINFLRKINERSKQQPFYTIEQRAVEKIMSWFNPTPQEAEDSYISAKRRYGNALYGKEAAEQKEQELLDEKNSVQIRLNNTQNEKTNFEKRISQIEQIIKMLEGSGSSWFVAGVPSVITTANKKSQKADESYKGCIRCNDIPAASLDGVIHEKSVEEDQNSKNALELFKKEKARLEEEVARLKSEIQSLTDQVSSIVSKVKECVSIQIDCCRVMKSASYDLNHFKKYLEY